MKKFDLEFLNFKLLNPLNLKLFIKDYLSFKYQISSNQVHIGKAINWLLLAQKKTLDGGISHSYSLISGWRPSYPETSGYILPTLIMYNHERKNNNLLISIEEISNWLYSIQLKNGGFQGETIEKKENASIFNTGQIILGLLEAYRELKNEKYFKSAVKAGNFLIKNQEKNGAWVRFCYLNLSHTYNVRTAWALLELFYLTDQKEFKDAAIKNLKWAIDQITEKYWFEKNTFFCKENPFLHFIAYTIRGFLESGLILEDKSLIRIALKSSLMLLDYYIKHQYLPATFDSNWESIDSYSCLTGNAQLSIIWLKLYEIFKDKKFLINAIELNNYLKSIQIMDNRYEDVNGAIKGSDPIWGNYMKFAFPNWATKFFCDALILENKILNNKI